MKRLTTDEELQQMLALSTYAFNFRNVDDITESLLTTWQHTINWGSIRNNKLASQVVVFPFCVNFCQLSLKMAGIGNVATYPEWRRQGDVRQLFQKITENLHENGTILSYLAPFNRPFYRKFGYETVFNKTELTLTQQDMVALGSEKIADIHRLQLTDTRWQEQIKELYVATLQQDDGSVIREDWWWQLMFDQVDSLWAIRMDNDGIATGYIRYEMGTAELIIHELVYLDRKTLDKLVSFIASHSATFSQVKFSGKSTEIIKFLLVDFSTVSQKVSEGMMVKIISFEQFIENYAFSPESSLSCQLTVIDDFSPWNQGVWKLKIVNGKGNVSRISQEITDESDFSGTIQSWTQVFFGTISLETQMKLTKIEIKETSKCKELANAITIVNVGLHDSF